MAGYSGTPLAKKLGIKAESRVWAPGAPKGYKKLVSPLPEAAKLVARAAHELDVIHFFTKSRRELAATLPGLIPRIKRDGAIWISWPKKASKVETDVSEDLIRTLALPLRLVDVKVCAVDETWSGLKLVIRKQHR
ncbi:MAG: DUF3052 domain-containing protein [Gammaproteobacteria bacterium]